MDNTEQMRINPLPSMTWNWLKMNDRQVELPARVASYYTEENSANKQYEADYEQMEGGMGSAFAAYVARQNAKIRRIEAEDAVYRMQYAFEEGSAKLGETCIHVPAGGNSQVIMDIAGDRASVGMLQTKILLEEDAAFTLVQIYHGHEESMIYSDIAAKVADRGKFSLIQLVISGRDVNLGCKVRLAGKNSVTRIDTAYEEREGCRLDMNYVANHVGRDSISEIYANGVLHESSAKTFRGTIDFVRGCAGSNGAEKEDVLLLGEHLKNQTIPLILCQEEDVEGAHGATIGKVSEDILFYLRSRGMQDAEIYHMLSKGRLISVANRITDKKAREDALALLGQTKEEEV